MTLCQCVITLRVWHLFPPSRSRFIRWLAVTVFIASLVAAAIFVAIDYDEIRNVTGTSVSQFNLAQALPFEYGIYLPALVVHTTMFLLTLYRFRVSPRTLQQHGMIHRFVKEGMFMYAFAAGEYIWILFVYQTLKQITGTMLHEIIGLSSERRQDISVYDVAILGEIVVAATVISVCRAMLSIRSLAATHHVDPAWLLNHAELSRVQWRMGTTEGEILVEVNEMDVVVPSRSLALPTRNIGREDEMQRLTHSRGNRIGV
ncbi:uncharacterized protein EDB93DRAFT_1249974 [Suillus bovinus]|uniref:uncharacterized protein n=1 Tax=Suillus bovinus TaxID=48563 RepID=UPI001B863876|nr:uncharacterized protein EDB93DRAFT_1249974 [Suillus bovinus]KAG2149033.1 hypothetical protein EDB93DRAFT_1249974 [Suillus bovinus]